MTDDVTIEVTADVAEAIRLWRQIKLADGVEAYWKSQATPEPKEDFWRWN